ncbi:DNA repair protein rad10 [Coccidioides immitis RS]|uniref:DNA repair protein rad10 n=2 Tax=Coccidioides immitis TaxID=5501 RepID=J3KD03_COCIM|nr:DNA repair protein rad10 [Coccidioides immitis RS]EAS33174.3 DNA repair protein rad10 [Coccidioides immitis RS]TPX20078.1 ssDNA endonuclease and repair protein rad10 [Coccidioides immitis]
MEEDFGEIPDFDSLAATDGTIPAPAPQVPPAKPPVQSNRIQQPKPQVIANRSARSAILVSARQKGNPILNHVRLLPWEYADIPADYVLGATTCALFLSLKYHRLHPEYVYSRIKLLGGKYDLRILLIMVDVPNHEDSLKELSKASVVNNLTLILCWSAAEAGHYLELFKSSENAPPTAIRSQQPHSYKDSLVEFITTPKRINKSDAASLISTFGSLRAAINAQPEQINSVPGWGEKKVSQWTNAVKEDFRTRAVTTKTAASRISVGAEDAKTQTRAGAEPGYMSELFNKAVEQERINAHSNTRKDIREPSLVIGSGESVACTTDTSNRCTKEIENGQEEINDGIMAALARLRKGK